MDATIFGEWADVPGLENELRVSTRGWILQFNSKTNRWFPPSRNTPNARGYVTIHHRDASLRVVRLMAMAFIGPPPTPLHTVDHIEKYDGDFMRERSDDRIENLRWATKSEQSKNQNKRAPRRDGHGILMWKINESKDTALRFCSIIEAAHELDLHHSCIRRVANGDQTHTGGYYVEYFSLEPDVLFSNEEFREINGFSVSQYGRAKDPRTKSFSFTPKATNGCEYAVLSRSDENGSSVTFLFHRLVALAWADIVGHFPGDGYTVDHKNRDKNNNWAYNLCWKTQSEQITNQSKENSASIFKKQKFGTRVQLRAPGEKQWQEFICLNDAVRDINAKYGTALSQPLLSQSLKIRATGRTLKTGRHKGWSIRSPDL